MCDESATNSFEDGDIVWVKVSNRWWPAEICSDSRVPQELLDSKRKKPKAIVKFFQEDTYEFVKDLNHLMIYNCPKKIEFIKKGLELYRANNKHMEKFPSDVQTAEKITGGDENILESVTELEERKKLNYSEIFGDSSKKSKKPKNTNRRQSISGRSAAAKNATPKNSAGKKKNVATPLATPKIESQDKRVTLKANYKRDVPNHESKIMLLSPILTPQSAPVDSYKCHLCSFTSSRQNVIILHTKSHTNPTPLVTILSETDSGKRNSDGGGILKSPSGLPSNTSKYASVIVIDDSEDSDEDALKQVEELERCVEDENVKKVNEKEIRVETPKPIEIEENDYGVEESMVIVCDKRKIQEEIRTEILADWSDEASGSDSDNSPTMNMEKRILDVENSLKEIERSQSPLDQPEPIRLGEELAQLMINKESSESSTDDKVSSSSIPGGRNSPKKYRNIPKKDRRAIVLKDFNNVDVLNEKNNAPKDEENVRQSIDELSKIEEEMSNSCKEIEQQDDNKIELESRQPDELTLNESTPIEIDIPVQNEPPPQIDKPVQNALPPENETPAAQNEPLDQPEKCTQHESPHKEIPKTIKKSAISCFDFQDEEEDEDFFTSLSKLKKKYLSPDKNKDTIENRLLLIDHFKETEIEKKDEQLTADIENLLNYTKLPEIKLDDKELMKPSTSNTDVVLREVRTLPPKERGKRIFKSRNRSRFEEAVTLTSSIETLKTNTIPVTWPPAQKKEVETVSEKILSFDCTGVTTDETNNLSSNVSITSKSVEGSEIINTTIKEAIIISNTKILTENATESKIEMKTDDQETNFETLTSLESGQVDIIHPEVDLKSDAQVSACNTEILEKNHDNDDGKQGCKDNIELKIQENDENNRIILESHTIAVKTDVNISAAVIPESMTQSELAVAEALISIPNAFELSTTINESTISEINSESIDSVKDEVDLIDQKTITTPEENTKLNAVNKPPPEEETPQVIKNGNSFQVVKEQTENLKIVEQQQTQNETSLPTIAQQTEKEDKSEKPTWVGTRKRRRAHMKNTPRKIVIVSSTIIGPPDGSSSSTDNGEKSSFKGSSVTSDVMETETVDSANQEASQTKILKLEEYLEINISIPDKLSDLEEVPRPQFSPLSPQIPCAKTDQKLEQTDENLSTSNIEILSSDRQFSPLTPPQPRFSPVRDITEFDEAPPSSMETDQPVQKNTVRSGLSESEPQEETCRINVKSLREQYEENFVQKYIKDAMMFESSSSTEEIKLNINESSELNTPRQRTEFSESMKASNSEESLKIETDTKVENKIAKSSKDTISEIRSFRLRRKNVKCNSDHLDKLTPSKVEIFVSKENLIVPEHMDVDKNLNSMINEIDIRNLAEESSVILQADGMTIDKRAIINVDTANSQLGEVDLEMKKYDGVKNNEIEDITQEIGTTNNIKNIKEIENSVADMTAVQNTEILDENQTNEINNLQSLEKNVGLLTAAQTLIPTSIEVNNQVSKNPSSESFISSSTVNLKNERKDFRIPKKRKQTFEDDIPSFVIEKPTPAIITITPTTSAHPPEKITKLDTTSITESKEMTKSNKTNNSKSGESFDIHNMPILLASDALVGSQSIATENVEKVQLIVASRTQGVISCEAIPATSPPLTSATVTVPPPPPPPPPAQSSSSSTNKTQSHTLTKTSTRGRKIAGQQVAAASSTTGAVVSNNSVTAQNRQTSTTPPMMTHQSSQIITAEGKEIGKDGKGNKFVIIKSGNSNKMIIRPDSPKATTILEQQKSSGSQQNVSTSVSSGSVICTQTLETATKGGAEIFPTKNTTQKGSQVLQQSYTAGQQVVITNKGAAISNNSETLTCTSGGNIQMGTSNSSNASGRNSNRRRSSKSNNNTPSTSNFQQGIGRMVIEQQKLLNNKTITQMGKSAMLATKNQELMPPPPAPITKRNDVADMEVERINSSSKGRRSTQSKSHSKYSSRNKIKSEEVRGGGGGAILVPEIQSSVQTNEPQKQQQHQMLQQTQQIQKIQHQQQLQKQIKHQQQQQQQQQLQQQFHQQQLQQQFQHQQQIQQQQQLQQQQQQQLRQQQEQHAQQQLQQQLHLQQQQQQTQMQQQQQHLQLSTKKSQSKSTLYSHSSEKNNSTSIMPESSKLPESITDGKSIINILPITSSNLPPNVEVDESEMGSYVAVQATDPNVFYLCKHQGDDEGLIPVISQPLYLDQNNGTLVLPHQIPIDASEMETEEKLTAEQDESQMVNVRISDEDSPEQRRILLSIEDNQDNQVVIDYETAVALINNSGGEDPVQLSVNDQLVSISVDTLAHAFGLTVDKETEQFIFTNIDLENSLQNATNPDILAAALAGTEVYQQQEIIGDVLVDPNNVSIVEQGGISFQPIDPQVTAAKATTNETNAILTQPPIMSTLEVPPNKKKTKFNSTTQKLNETTGLIGQNLDESLAKIGVTTQSSVVPSSLELPITVTNPAIAPKTTSNPILLEGIYTTGLSQASQMSPPISSAIAHEQQDLSYEILTSSSVQSMSSATILNTNTGRGVQQHHHHHQQQQQQQQQQQHHHHHHQHQQQHHQQATEFGVVQSPNSVSANVSAYDDPAR